MPDRAVDGRVGVVADRPRRDEDRLVGGGVRARRDLVDDPGHALRVRAHASPRSPGPRAVGKLPDGGEPPVLVGDGEEDLPVRPPAGRSTSKNVAVTTAVAHAVRDQQVRVRSGASGSRRRSTGHPARGCRRRRDRSPGRPAARPGERPPAPRPSRCERLNVSSSLPRLILTAASSAKSAKVTWNRPVARQRLAGRHLARVDGDLGDRRDDPLPGRSRRPGGALTEDRRPG